MHEFNHPEHQASFKLPEDPTRRQLLAYDGFELSQQPGMYPRLWDAAKTVIQEWQCESTPLDVDLDAPDGTEDQIEIIKWAALAVFSWRLELKRNRIEKN